MNEEYESIIIKFSRKQNFKKFPEPKIEHLLQRRSVTGEGFVSYPTCPTPLAENSKQKIASKTLLNGRS